MKLLVRAESVANELIAAASLPLQTCSIICGVTELVCASPIMGEIKIKKYILHNTYHILDGSRGIQYRLGSRTDRGLNSDYDREWLMVNDSLFKKVKF